MRSFRQHHRAGLVLALVAVLLLPLAAFLALGRGDDDPAPPPAGTEPAPDTETLPLLGAAGEVPDRPALAVKVDDTDGGRPQANLAAADVVVEEVVEGGLTRLVVVYHSQAPERVGPVRSARSTDIPLLAELERPAFAWSGANPTFAAAVRQADVIDVGLAAAPDAYRRSDDRRAPYNLYASATDLWAAAEDGNPDAGPPPALFTYGDGAGEAVGGFDTAGSPGLATDIRWAWDDRAGAWARTQDGTAHVDDDGTQVTAANVVVRFTPYRDSGVRDSAGGVVPEAVAVGEGAAWLLRDGRVQRGRWAKGAPEGPTTYTDASGEPLAFAPGRTWVEVLAPGTGRTIAAGDPRG